MQFQMLTAGTEDIELLVQHRLRMFLEMLPELESEVEASEAKTKEWIQQKMSEGTLVGFIAKTVEGQVLGSGCLWLREERPNPWVSASSEPYLMSMYTEKVSRREGVATMIVQKAIEWSQEHGYDAIYLHASPEGRRLYESLGFHPTSEMRLRL